MKILRLAAFAEEHWGVNTNIWLTAMLEKYKQKKKELSIDIEVQLFQINEGSFSGIPSGTFFRISS